MTNNWRMFGTMRAEQHSIAAAAVRTLLASSLTVHCGRGRNGTRTRMATASDGVGLGMQ
jgi:hypothetical protein